MTNYQTDEQFELVDASGKVVGLAPRRRCHGDPALRHRAVHVLVFNPAGHLFLQKRSRLKDTAPGLWDTSVGGHPQPGESPMEAARRECSEELGLQPGALHEAYTYTWSTPYETELISAFATGHSGPFLLAPDEIDEGRFWPMAEIDNALRLGIFTPQFVQEYPRMTTWWAQHHDLLESTRL